MDDQIKKAVSIEMNAEQESFYRQMFENFPVALFSCNVEGYITYYNQAAAQLWGQHPELGTARWCGAWKIYDLTGNILSIEEYPMFILLKQGELTQQSEIVIERPDSTKKIVRAFPSLRMDGNGKLTGAINMLVDISEQKGVEMDLAKLAAIVQSSTDAIISKTTNGIVTSWNPAATRLFGYTEEEMIGQPIQKLIPPERHNEEAIILDRIRKGERVEHFDTTRIRKDGSPIEISLTISPIRNAEGKIIGASKIVRDITSQKLMQKQLEEKEERLRVVISSTKLGTWDWNLETNELIWDERCKFLFGLEENENVDYELFLQKIHPDDRQNVIDHINDLLRPDGGENYNIEYRATGSDNKLRWLNAKGKIYYNAKGKKIRFAGTIHDINAQKLAEQQLRENEERLRMAIEATSLGTWDYQPQTGKLFWSDECKRIYDIPLDVPITFELFESQVHPEDRKMALEAIFGAMDPKSNGNYDIEYRILRYSDNEPRWIRAQGKVYFDHKMAPELFIGTVLDISVEKNRELKLLDSVKLFTKMADTVPVVIWITGPDGTCNYFNEQWYSFTGQTENTALGFGWMDAVHPNDVDDLKTTLLESTKKHEGFNTVFRLRRSDGVYIWVMDTGRPKYGASGQFDGFIGVLSDMDERKRAEEALQESEERFRSIANTAPVMIWMSGDDKYSDFFNTCWLNFTGRTIEQESGDGWQQGVHPDDLENCIKVYDESYAARQAFHVEYRLRRYDGQYRWVSDSAVPRYTPMGQFIGFISACMDIDDEKIHNKRLQESELLFKTIASVSPVGLWMTDEKGTTTFINQTWSEWTGLRLGDGSSPDWMTPALPAEKELMKKQFNHRLSLKQKFSNEFRFLRKDGQVRWGLTEGFPYYSESRHFAGYAGSVTDITERKQNEMLKNDFLTVASHELKTPLTSIKAYTQLLAKAYERASDAFLKNGLTKVENQVNKMTKLVSDFLNLSKIESDKFTLEIDRFEMNDLVKEIATDIQMVAINHTIVLRRTDPVWVNADREKISQVITNFLNNAIKYSPEDKSIIVAVTNINDWVNVSVTDKGIGIEPGEHEKIFQRFYRSQFNNNISFSGFGIGLYISAEIINRHRGEIGVNSEQGKGAEFYFRLPKAQ